MHVHVTARDRAQIERLRWTHGALERDATLGFLMSDDPLLPLDGPARFDEALAPLAARRAPK